jgi:phenylacetate-CoA ligase
MSAFYAWVVKKVVFPTADIIKGTALHQSYVLVKSLEFAPRESIVQFQTEYLRKLLKHATTNVPYYIEYLKYPQLNHIDSFELSNLNSLPILSKRHIKDNYSKLITKDIAERAYKKHSTGGSTGIPLVFLLDLHSWSVSWANSIRGWEMGGYLIGDKVLVLGSHSLFLQSKKTIEQKLIHTLFNYHPVAAMNMADEVCEKCIEIIRRKKIKIIFGYASAIFILAKYIINHKIKVDAKLIIPTSEVCPKYYKDKMHAAFQCQIIDAYGARDGNVSAFECEFGNYHISETSIVTINKNNTNSILVTDLFNYTMPLINYEVGDSLELSNEICACGRNQFIAKRIYGRHESVMHFANGKVITGPGWTILFKDRKVEKYSIEKKGEYSIVVNIVPSSDYQKEYEESLIRETFHKHIGKEIKVEIKYHTKMDKLESGKSAYFIGDSEK